MTKTILLVEDHDINRLLFSQIIQSQGHKVIECSDGEEACNIVNNGGVDLVVMDIRLDGSKINGIESVKRIRSDQKYAKLPILALTAYASQNDRNLCMQAGFNSYLSKPFQTSELIQTLETLLSK